MSSHEMTFKKEGASFDECVRLFKYLGLIMPTVASLQWNEHYDTTVATVYFDAYYFESAYIISHKELGHWPCYKTLALL